MAQPSNTTLQIPTQRRRARFVPDSFNEEEGTVLVTWTTGEESIEFDPFPGPFIERLSFDPEHLDLSRLKSGTAAVMDAHGSYDRRGGGPKIADQVGVVEDAWVVRASEVPGESEAVARIRLSNRASVAELRQDVADGIVANISVSYRVNAYRDVTGPDDPIPVKLAVSWTPTEISFVPVGHDSGARTRSTSNLNSCTIETSTTEDTTMAKKAGTPSPPATPPTAAPTPVELERQRGLAIRSAVTSAHLPDDFATDLIERQEEDAPITVERAHALIFERLAEAPAGSPAPPEPAAASASPAATPDTDAAKAERTRGLEIRKAVGLAGLAPEFADELISTDNQGGTPLSLDRCRALIFDRLAEEGQGTMTHGNHTTVGASQFDKVRSGMANALEVRCNVKNADGTPTQLTEHGRNFRGMTMVRLAEEFFQQAGEGDRLRGMTRDEMCQFALVRSRSIAAPHSTGDFSSLLANVANKKLRAGYDSRPSDWKRFSSRSDATDFKSMSRTALGDFPGLTKVLPGAEYEMGTIGEGGETYAIAKYGKRIAFTREAMLNDDLSAFDRLPLMAGRRAMDLEADLAWALITNNASMADGVALFASGHSNIGTGALTADATGIASLGTGRAVMRKQTGIDGAPINVEPALLIVPAALEVAAQSLTTAVNPNQPAGVNPFSSQFEGIIVEPRLDVDSTAKWYMAGNPNQVDVLEHAYLMGNDGPTILTREGFEIDGLEMKVRHEFGVAVIDHRGLYRSTGV